jgi:hypothetical protein
MKTKTTSENKKEERCRDERHVKTWDECVEAGDVRDRKNTNEDNGSESKESEDLMWRLKVFGLFRIVSFVSRGRRVNLRD